MDRTEDDKYEYITYHILDARVIGVRPYYELAMSSVHLLSVLHEDLTVVATFRLRLRTRSPSGVEALYARRLRAKGNRPRERRTGASLSTEYGNEVRVAQASRYSPTWI